MILCEWDASEGNPGQSCVHLYARILSTSSTSVSIFSVWCYFSVLYLNGTYEKGPSCPVDPVQNMFYCSTGEKSGQFSTRKLYDGNK
jgi:hypothetical protein